MLLDPAPTGAYTIPAAALAISPGPDVLFVTATLGCFHSLLGLVFLLGVGCAAGKASGWLAKHNFARWLDGFADLFFIALPFGLPLRAGRGIEKGRNHHLSLRKVLKADHSIPFV